MAKISSSLKKINAEKVIGLVCLTVTLLLPSLAFADLNGGLSTTKSNLDTIKNWAMTFAGVGAVLYLLFKAVQAWQGRCEWGEFGMAVFYVALAGGSVTIAAWAFSLFA